MEILRITDFKTGSLVIKNLLESVIHEYTFYENDYNQENVIDELTDAICRAHIPTSSNSTNIFHTKKNGKSLFKELPIIFYVFLH